MPKKPLVKEARMALNEFKEEIANELGISTTNTNLASDITSRQAGQIGEKNNSKNMTYNSNSIPADF